MNKNKRKQIKPRYVLWLVVLLCLIFIGVSLKNNGEKLSIQNGISSLILPMEKGLNSVGQWFGEQKEHNRSLNELSAENEELKQQIEQLNTKISSMENNLSELEALRELLKMKELDPDYDMVGARVISKNAGNWFHSFTIDKGSNDGIKKDMNVIYDNGLVGIVTDVAANSATVRAIIDDTSSVSGMLSKSNELCIVNGDLQLYQEGLLDVEMISKDAQVAAGDEVVTSYISDKYLPGLVIGYISNVSMDSSNLSQNAEITPKVSFDNITNVMVITQLKADMVASEAEEEES